MTRVLGIDLGTTNSCVAVVEAGAPLVVPVDKGSYTLPSVVAVSEDGRHHIGASAKRQAIVNAEHTVYAAKRIIGRDMKDPMAQQVVKASTYRCVAGPDGEIRIHLRGKDYAVPEISALVLGELKRAAAQYLGEVITQAVITVPAYFGDRQRQATVDAGKIAGLDVLRIINEPTAAALAYGALQRGGERTVAVYDLGGGTFDVSVLRVAQDVVEVLATAGDPFLGGRDFDQRILDWLIGECEREHGMSLRADRNAMQRLRDAAEGTKHELSEQTSADVALPFLATKSNGEPLHLQTKLERAAYEAMVADYVDRTLSMFSETIEAAELEPSKIDEVILVGGMTRMPLIQQRVTEVMGRAPSSGVHPDLVVAVGAAIQGSLLVAEQPDFVLMDVTPHNLGIMAFGGFAETVIPKDTTIPTEAKRVFATARDNQEQVKIVVFQGDHKRIEKNDLLGEFTLTGLRRAPRGQVKIEVTFAISADGIVSVAARDVETGLAQTIQVAGTHRLEEDEIKRMVAEHQENLLSAIAEEASPAGAPEPAPAGGEPR